MARDALVEHVPRPEPEVGPHHKRDADAEHQQPRDQHREPDAIAAPQDVSSSRWSRNVPVLLLTRAPSASRTVASAYATCRAIRATSPRAVTATPTFTG